MRTQTIKLRASVFVLFLEAFPAAARAHHGVAGVGVGSLEGPGAAVESATSTTIPHRTFLLYSKLDYTSYKRFTPQAGDESDHAQFWMFGAGYGIAPWLSAYLFLPLHVKIDEPGGYNTRGLADVSALAQVGFKYDEGFRLNSANESLDDLLDWHFTVYGGGTLPSGNPNLKDGSGAIDPGKSTGFGRPSLSVGVTATKMLTGRYTFNFEGAYLQFLEYAYSDGNRNQFGRERRVNLGGFYRLMTNLARRMRLDAGLEVQYLGLGRDRSNGTPESATGGDMIYGLPGMRLYWGPVSAAVGVKIPAVTWLNESGEQQGAEGKERFRFISTLSLLF